MKKALYIVAAVILVLALLTACAKEKTVEPQLTYAELLAIFKSTVDPGLEGKINYVKGWHWNIVDDRIWGVGALIDPQSNEKQPSTIISCDTDGKAVFLPSQFLQTDEEIAATATEGQVCNAFISNIVSDSHGTLYIIRCDCLETQTEDTYHMDRHYYSLCGIDNAGIIGKGIRLQFPEELTYIAVNDAFFDSEGNLWMCSFTDLSQMPFQVRLYCFSPQDGSLIKSISLPDNQYITNRKVFQTQTGDFLLFARDFDYGFEEKGYIVHAPLSDNPRVEPLPFAEGMAAQDVSFVYTDSYRCTADQVYIKTIMGIYSWDIDAQTITPLYLWKDYGINNNKIQATFILSDGRALVITQKKQFGDFQFTTLSSIDEDILAGRPVVTLGTLEDGTDTVQKLVETYNYTEPEVYIKLLDYSDAAAAEKNYASGYEMLQNDIRNRTGPDILLLSGGIDTENYIHKGMFADLYPYIDADPSLNRDDFLPGILTAGEYDGQLPTITTSYKILTATGDRDVVGSVPGWSWDEYDTLTTTWPAAVPFYNYTRENILLYLLQMGGDVFVDYTNSEVHLDSPEFIRLLQTTVDYPSERGDQLADPKSVFAARKALMQISFVGTFRDVLIQEYAFDGPVTYKGFPSDTGNNCAAVPDLCMAISATCKDPDAAWAFLRTLLLPEFQQSLQQRGSFPLRADSLQAMASTAMQLTETNYTTPAYLGADLTEDQLDYFKQGITQAQADQIVALVQSATTLYRYDRAIANILSEEASAFYAGARTAEDAAAVMQNRVQTYLDEQG